MNELAALAQYLLMPASLAAFGVLLAAIVAAALVYRPVKRWYAHRPDASGFAGILFEATVVASPYLAALVLAAAGRTAVAAAGLDTELLDPALKLIAALVLIRCAVFLLRLSLSPHSRFRSWENGVAVAAWLLVAMQLFGWLEAVIEALDSVGLAAGTSRITLWSLVAAVFTITVFVIASVWIARWLDRRIATIDALAPSTRIGIAKTTYAFVIGFGLLAGLRASGVDLTALTVFSGAIGLGLGFGLQAIAANFVSGFVLLLDKSIKPGDVISFTGTLGTSTHGFGWVEELRGRYIVIRDRDGVATLVPNQNVITNQVINWSYGHPKVRLRLPVRISYRDDVELALRLLLEATRDHPRIIQEPPPVTRLMDFTDYGMEIEVRFWIGDPKEGVNNVRSDVNRRIWALFREHGVTMPPAQREIRILEGGQSASSFAPRAQGPIEPSNDGQD